MRGNGHFIGLRAALLIFTVALFVTSVRAATETVLHSFDPKFRGGTFPQGSLIFDAAGNLYGTTSYGGAHGGCGSANCGTGRLDAQSGRGLDEEVLQNPGNGTDGAVPVGSLIFDASGDLYGTTSAGGTYSYGTVFELSPKAGGGWTEKVLHNFIWAWMGAGPFAGLIFDGAGNLPRHDLQRR